MTDQEEANATDAPSSTYERHKAQVLVLKTARELCVKIAKDGYDPTPEDRKILACALIALIDGAEQLPILSMLGL